MPTPAVLPAVVLALGVGLLSPAPAHAAPLEVTTTADSGPGSLRDALAQAAATPDDDTVTFAPTLTGTITLTSGALTTSVGGGSGDLTVIGPGAETLVVDAAGTSRVLDVTGSGSPRPTLTLSGLALTRGSATAYEEVGGALRARDTDVVLDQVVVSDSAAAAGGGGVSVTGGSLVVADAVFSGDSVSGDGYGNGRGGGIQQDAGDAQGTSVSVADTTLSDNTAGYAGGALHVVGATPVTVTGSMVVGNTARALQTFSEGAIPHGDGGGIAAGVLTLRDSRITGNTAGVSGGGVAAGTLEMIGSTIDGNRARTLGGGIAADALRVTSSSVTANYALRGGAIAMGASGEAVLVASTVTHNDATDGGGIRTDGPVSLRDSVVAMSSEGDLAGAGTATLDHSLVQDARGFATVEAGGAITGADPLLGELADHGGATPTVLPAPGSPLVDAAGASTAEDQRGTARPVGPASDIGAVEATASELAGPTQVALVERPRITGPARVGETLRTDGGRWAPGDVELTYQWLTNGVPIEGATSAAYTLTPQDYDRSFYGSVQRPQISVRVTASAPGRRDGQVTSDSTNPVVKGLLTTRRPPQLAGRLRVGSVLRVLPHVRAVEPRARGVRTLEWFLGGRRLRSAYGERRLTLRPRMRGSEVAVKVTYVPPAGYRPLTIRVTGDRRIR